MTATTAFMRGVELSRPTEYTSLWRSRVVQPVTNMMPAVAIQIFAWAMMVWFTAITFRKSLPQPGYDVQAKLSGLPVCGSFCPDESS